MIDNLRVPKVFVFNPATEMVTTNTVTPDQLTLGQVGFHRHDTKVGTGVASTPITCPAIEIHQNLGDNKFGTIRTKPIHAERVRGWHAVKAAVAVAQVTYIGYDEVDNTKQLSAVTGQEIIIAFNVWDNEIKKWYGNVGYTRRISYTGANCQPCLAECEPMDQDAIADWIIAEVLGTNFPAGSFPTNAELKNFITAAEKVTTGTIGTADYRVGVKLTGKIYTPELLSACDIQQQFKPNLTTFSASIPQSCPNFPVTTTIKAAAGNGWPGAARDLEKESQGYDRVREAFDHPKFMLNNFILRAADGAKYDYYYLEYDWSHMNATPIQSAETKDPHIAIFIVPTGTGANLQTMMNAWLTPLGFAAVTIAASTGKGTAPYLINS